MPSWYESDTRVPFAKPVTGLRYEEAALFSAYKVLHRVARRGDVAAEFGREIEATLSLLGGALDHMNVGRARTGCACGKYGEEGQYDGIVCERCGASVREYVHGEDWELPDRVTDVHSV